MGGREVRWVSWMGGLLVVVGWIDGWMNSVWLDGEGAFMHA